MNPYILLIATIVALTPCRGHDYDIDKIKSIATLSTSIEFTVELTIETPKGNSTKFYSGETQGVILPNSKLCITPLSTIDRASYPSQSTPPGGTVTSQITKIEIRYRGETIPHSSIRKNIALNILLIELNDSFPSDHTIEINTRPTLLENLVEIGITPMGYGNAIFAQEVQAISEPSGIEDFTFLSKSSPGSIIINRKYELIGISTNHIKDSQPGRIGLLPFIKIAQTQE